MPFISTLLLLPIEIAPPLPAELVTTLLAKTPPVKLTVVGVAVEIVLPTIWTEPPALSFELHTNSQPLKFTVVNIDAVVELDLIVTAFVLVFLLLSINLQLLKVTEVLLVVELIKIASNAVIP